MKTILSIVLILLTLLFLQRECSRPNPQPAQQPTVTSTVYSYYKDTIIFRYIPKPYPVKVIDTFPMPANVDTAAILKEFHSMNIYDRTLMDDSFALIRLIDTVNKNQLSGAVLEYKNRQPVTIYQTHTIHPPPDPRFQLYAGGFIQGNTESFGAGPALFAKTKRDHLYGIGYDAINKQAQIHMQWKISFRKE